MTPLKYHLLRAAYDWAVENGLTPHVIVDAAGADVMVPARFVENGRIVLNVSPQAVQAFHFDAEAIAFSARFGGVAQNVHVPLASVLAVYARETGQGVSFPTDRSGTATASDSEPDKTPPDGTPPRKGPALKIVK
jgi:stringent starvation protein B